MTIEATRHELLQLPVLFVVKLIYVHPHLIYVHPHLTYLSLVSEDKIPFLKINSCVRG